MQKSRILYSLPLSWKRMLNKNIHLAVTIWCVLKFNYFIYYQVKSRKYMLICKYSLPNRVAYTRQKFIFLWSSSGDSPRQVWWISRAEYKASSTWISANPNVLYSFTKPVVTQNHIHMPATGECGTEEGKDRDILMIEQNCVCGCKGSHRLREIKNSVVDFVIIPHLWKLGYPWVPLSQSNTHPFCKEHNTNP